MKPLFVLLLRCYFYGMNADKKYQTLLRRATEMRKGMTQAELKLYAALIDPKHDLPPFYAQHVIFPFIVDFACLENLLIIEVDGVSHKSSKDSDDVREKELTRLGFKIIRFTNGEVLVDVKAVIQQVQFECRYRSSIKMEPTSKPVKKPLKRKMIVPLPRVVYEEPALNYSRTRASKVRIRKSLDKSKGEKARVICAICRNPIANADLRVRHRDGRSDEVLWAHKSCKN